MATYYRAGSGSAGTGTSCTFVRNASIQSGDLALGIVGYKDYNANPSGATSPVTLYDNPVSGTTASSGDGTGSMAQQLGAWIDDGATKSLTTTNATTVYYGCETGWYSDSAKYYWDSCSGAGEHVSGLVSLTGDSTLNLVPGDRLIVFAHSSSTTYSAQLSTSVTVPGVTLGSYTNHRDFGTATGTDCLQSVWSYIVSSGTATGAPQYSRSSTYANVAMTFVVLRDGAQTVASSLGVYTSISASGTIDAEGPAQDVTLTAGVTATGYSPQGFADPTIGVDASATAYVLLGDNPHLSGLVEQVDFSAYPGNTLSTAKTLYRKDGVWHTRRMPQEHHLDGADRIYRGGYTYALTLEQAYELKLAGLEHLIDYRST